MADNKLSWSELRRIVAQRAGVGEKEANAFLNAFNAQLLEALKADKQVKVNGLGTFKLQAVAPRKSVNVTTGEEIVIEGYNKIGFVPEAGVKELVESGKATVESASEADPIRKLGAQAEEIVDILGELGQSPDKNEPVAVSEAPKEEPKEEPKQEPKEVKPEEHKQEPKEQKPKKKYHFVRDTLICVVILLMLLLVGYFFLRNEFSQLIEDLMNKKPQTEQVEPAQEPEVSTMPEEELEAWTYDEILLTEKVTYGSRLAWIAKKHYGDKVYWPYLYAANKDRLTNPSKIGVGLPIRVPKLSAEQRDTTDVRFLQLREEAYGKLKIGK